MMIYTDSKIKCTKAQEAEAYRRATNATVKNENWYQYQFNKLIRDKLPERMTKEGVVINSFSLNSDQYIQKLKAKLIEEAKEVEESEDLQQLKIELADVLEVIYALAEAHSITLEEIESERLIKRSINGKFNPDCYVNYIEVSKDNKKVIDYMESKNRSYINNNS